MGDETYMSQLKAERDNIDQSFTHAIRLLGEGKLAMTVFLEQNFQKTWLKQTKQVDLKWML